MKLFSLSSRLARPLTAARLAALAGVLLLGGVRAAQAATLTVTNTADSGTGSLRGQIAAAAAGDTINFDATLFSTAQTIQTTSRLSISKNLTITGTGARLLTVRRNTTGAFAIFSTSNAAVAVSGMTVSNGNNTAGGGSAFVANSGSLTLDGVAATGNGGAESAVGGLGSATVTITNCLISNNSVTGVLAEGTATTIANTSISGNNGNNQGITGGIYGVSGALSLNNVTLANNIGGGVQKDPSAGTLNIRNTLITGSTGGADAIGAFTSQGNNLISNAGTATGFVASDKTGVAANIGALANNGGPTDTHALNTSSPAIDAGNSCVTSSSCGVNNPPANLTTDQRGTSRPQGSAVDIGAFELVQASAPSVTTPTSANITPTSATLGGNVTADNGTTITERGVVYAPTATNADPLIGGTGVVKVTASGTIGVFTAPVTGLTASTSYSFKAYATSANGTSYSSVASFSTLAAPPAPSVSIGSASVLEGNTGVGTPESGTKYLSFPLTLSAASSSAVTVTYSTSNGTATGGTAVGAPTGADYLSATGATVTIAAGQTSGTLTVAVLGDTQNEANETLSVTLSGASGATLGTSTATGTIQNDDNAPTLSIEDGSAKGSAGSAEFTLNLSNPSNTSISVTYATGDGTATAPANYAAQNGTLTFTAGLTTKSITVTGLTTTTTDRKFQVTLSAPSGATLARATATGTILAESGSGQSATASGATVTLSGLRRNRTTGRFVQPVLIQNNTGAALSGPLYLVLDNMAANLSLYAPGTSGYSANVAPLGSPYFTLGALAAGASQTIEIEFVNPSNGPVSFQTRVLRGPGTP